MTEEKKDSTPMPSAASDDAAKGLDDHALAGMLEQLANAAADRTTQLVREARNRARWLRERATTSGAAGTRERDDQPSRSSTPGGGSEEPGTSFVVHGQTRTTVDGKEGIHVFGAYGHGAGGALFSVSFSHDVTRPVEGMAERDIVANYPVVLL